MNITPDRRMYPPRLRELLVGLFVAIVTAVIFTVSILGMLADHLGGPVQGAP